MANSQLHLQAGRLLEVVNERPGAAIWRVRLGDEAEAEAIAFTALGGDLTPGQSVWLNTTAVELGLGTGGFHFVVCPLDKAGRARTGEIGDAPDRSAGHLLKLRYTPLQHRVFPTEESALPDARETDGDLDLGGLSVLTAELHSAAMAAAIAAQACGASRVVYVMSDGAALSLPFSAVVARLRESGTLAGTITAGQAFGGDLEAVTVASALVAARTRLRADLVIVAQGPGNAGTGTSLGFSGLAQAEHLNAVAALGGRPVAALRISFADTRSRHHGLSDHTATALGRMTLARTVVAVPALGEDWDRVLRHDIHAAGLSRRHELRCVSADDLLRTLEPYREILTTMGRTVPEDRAFFLAACAAARLAVDPSAGTAWDDSP
jgi:hypothetical protein